GYDKNTCVQRYTPHKVVKQKVAFHKFLDVGNKQRGNNVVGDGEKHQKSHNHKIFPIGFGVGKQPFHKVAVLHLSVKAYRRFFVLNGSVGNDDKGGKHSQNCAYNQKGKILFHYIPSFSSSSFCNSTMFL